MRTIEDATDTLNGLLRGELSAVETYEKALRQGAEEPGAEEVRRLAGEHREAVSLLRRDIVDRHGTPTTNAGAWGLWAKTVQGVSQLLGSAAALRALRQGEAHVVRLYENALADEDLPPGCQSLIRSRLLPRARAHLLTLDGFLRAWEEEPARL